MNDNINNTAKLIQVKNQILKTEEQIQKIIMQMAKKRKIDYERPKDYGFRSFSLVITFDEFNIEAFSDDNIKLIKELYREYVTLRKQQQPLERQYDSEQFVKQQIKNDMRSNK